MAKPVSTPAAAVILNLQIHTKKNVCNELTCTACPASVVNVSVLPRY